MTQENKNLVIQYQMAVSEVLKTGQGDAFKTFLADDVTWHLPKSMEALGGSQFKGKDGVEKMLTVNVGKFYKPESIQVDFRSMISEQDLVHIHFGMSAETPQGKTYSNDYQVLYEISNGKIVNVWEYFDAHHLIELMG